MKAELEHIWQGIKDWTSLTFWRVATLTTLVAAATSVEGGLIPMLDSATARQGAAQVSVEQLRFADQAQPGFAELTAAVERFRDGKVEEAMAGLEAAANLNDRLPPPKVMLSRMFFATGEIGRGREQLEQAAIEHPNHADVYLALGDLALVEARVTDAALQYEKALAVLDAGSGTTQQKSVDATSGLAAVAERREQWSEAERLLVKCIELAPQNAAFPQRLARVLFEQQRYEEAAARLSQAAELDGEMQSPALIMGRWHHVAGHSAEAEKWMQTALEQAPDAPQTLVAAALWCLESSRPQEAQKHLHKLANVQSDAPQLLRLQGLAAMDLGDFETAERCFQSLTTENPGDFASSNQLALALIEQPSEVEQRRALQIAELNTRQYPNSPEARATLGWISYRLGHLDSAERIFQPMVAAGLLSPDAAYFAAKLLIDCERTDDARTLLSGALDASRSFRNRDECQSLLDALMEPTEAP